MLIPQFTVRWLLGLMTVCAGVFSVFAMGMRGSQTAAAVSMAILGLVAIILVHILLFGAIWLCSVVLPRPGERTLAPPEIEPAAPPDSPSARP